MEFFIGRPCRGAALVSAGQELLGTENFRERKTGLGKRDTVLKNLARFSFGMFLPVKFTLLLRF